MMTMLDMHAKCQDGPACHGPGCRVKTGKTAHKENWKRPKPNQHEASRDAVTSKKKKS